MELTLRPEFTVDQIENETVVAVQTMDVSMSQRRMLMRGINCG
jgi:hypothetical protein